MTKEMSEALVQYSWIRSNKPCKYFQICIHYIFFIIILNKGTH